jgi:hypothetical protein
VRQLLTCEAPSGGLLGNRYAKAPLIIKFGWIFGHLVSPAPEFFVLTLPECLTLF